MDAGQKVRFTRKFLRNTGQYAGQGHAWIVQACGCANCVRGDTVRLNERSAFFTPEGFADIAGTPDYEAVQWRHAAVANMEAVK